MTSQYYCTEYGGEEQAKDQCPLRRKAPLARWGLMYRKVGRKSGALAWHFQQSAGNPTEEVAD